MRSILPSSARSHAIIHASSLIRLRPSVYHKYSSRQLVKGQEPNISHLKIFRCTVHVLIAPPQNKYLEPMTGDLFNARFAYCHFNETIFPSLEEEKVDPNKKEVDLTWNAMH